MNLKLSPKLKKILLVLAVLLVAVFVVYSVIRNASSGGGEEPSTGRETVAIETPKESEAGNTAASSETQEGAGTESAVLPWGTEAPSSTAAPKTTEAPRITEAPKTSAAPGITVKKGQSYSDKDHVALYLHLYKELPPNYITKSQAETLGWSSSKGNLAKVAPGKSIGGDTFGNREGLLPKKSGRKYYECDIDYRSGTRNAKRIIYSNDGLIFYTDDHYESFTQLY